MSHDPADFQLVSETATVPEKGQTGPVGSMAGSAAVDYSCPECGDFQGIHSHSKLNETCSFCGAKVTAKGIAFVGVKQDRTWLTAILPNSRGDT